MPTGEILLTTLRRRFSFAWTCDISAVAPASASLKLPAKRSSMFSEDCQLAVKKPTFGWISFHFGAAFSELLRFC